jgi:hypothetical protein
LLFSFFGGQQQPQRSFGGQYEGEVISIWKRTRDHHHITRQVFPVIFRQDQDAAPIDVGCCLSLVR